jgi:hypothetical protein
MSTVTTRRSRKGTVTAVLTITAAWLQAADQAAEGAGLIRSAQNGGWSAPGTWEGGKVPAAGARVQIRAGHTVTYDLKSDRVIRSVHVAGTLRFPHDRDTRLDVGLIKVQPGDDSDENGFDCEAHVMAPPAGQPRPALEVGTPDRPVEAGHTALIRLTYVNGLDKQSCPAVVCCGGRMDFHGAPLSRTWVKLGATAKKGDAAVTLAEPVRGWRVGDRILVRATEEAHKFYGTRRPGKGAVPVLTEERTVAALDGTRLTLDRPLAVRGQGTSAGSWVCTVLGTA